MALFSRKNLKTHKWVTFDDIPLLLEYATRKSTTPMVSYYFLVDKGEVKDIEDLYREPVQLELRGITLKSNGKNSGEYNFVTEQNIEIFENMLKEYCFYNRILIPTKIYDC